MSSKVNVSGRKIKSAILGIYLRIRRIFNRIRLYRKPKVFVIGLNKTGTTTMAKTLRDFGFVVASEKDAKPLFNDWVKGDFDPIIKFCKSAEAFQDSPFSFPGTYIALDKAFPGSKFILTIRDDEDQWYRSITRFHSKLWGDGDGVPPSKLQLQLATSSYRSRPWDVNQALFKTPENDPYNEEIMKKFYVDYNKSVVKYFEERSDDLLIINVGKEDSYRRLVNFLKVNSSFNEFPWENKT